MTPSTATIAVLIGPLALGLVLTPVDDRGTSSKRASRPERVEIAAVENAYRLTPNLYSGGEPRGREGLAALKGLGIRTIISVDGSRPDVEGARALGLRYVHLPVGYDGIAPDQAMRIVAASGTLPGPVFVHCHHGKHRGPAAAALCVVAADGWGRDDAVAWLNQAGTSPDYRGLFAAVRDFRPLTAEEAARVVAAFPEKAETPAIVDAMVAIDGRWDRLKASREAGFRTPPNHPDVIPGREALLLAEDLRELARGGATKGKGEGMAGLMEESARLALDLVANLRRFEEDPTGSSRQDAEAAFAAVGKACVRCHGRYRDNP